jgi:hypothetical protein
MCPAGASRVGPPRRIQPQRRLGLPAAARAQQHSQIVAASVTALCTICIAAAATALRTAALNFPFLQLVCLLHSRILLCCLLRWLLPLRCLVLLHCCPLLSLFLFLFPPCPPAGRRARSRGFEAAAARPLPRLPLGALPPLLLPRGQLAAAAFPAPQEIVQHLVRCTVAGSAQRQLHECPLEAGSRRLLLLLLLFGRRGRAPPLHRSLPAGGIPRQAACQLAQPAALQQQLEVILQL